MQEMGLRSRIRRKHRCNYSSSIGGRVAENMLQRDFTADALHQKWVTDVTQRPAARLDRLQTAC